MPARIRNSTSNKGVALLLAMVMMFLTFILILSLLYMATSKYFIMSRVYNYAKFLYAYEAAMQSALWNCHTNNFTLPPITENDIKMDITISSPDSSGQRTIVITNNF